MKTQLPPVFKWLCCSPCLSISLLYYWQHRCCLSTTISAYQFLFIRILLVYRASAMMFRNTVSRKSSSVLSHEKDLKIRREAGISQAIQQPSVGNVYYPVLQGQRGKKASSYPGGHYQSSAFLWHGFFPFFAKRLQFLQICLNWYITERWIMQVVMFPSVILQKLLLAQCWPSYRDTFSPNSTDTHTFRSNFF